MKLKVTHSARPCAASVRRASATRCLMRGQCRERHRRDARQRDRRHRVEAAQPQHFLDQVAFRLDLRAAFGGLRRERGIERLRLVERRRAPRCRCARTAPRPSPVSRRGSAPRSRGVPAMRPPRPAECRSRRDRRCVRSAAWRRAARPVALPASVTAPGSPPHSSRIIAVAASIASGISAGSMPRSKRWRASETIWCRRAGQRDADRIEQRAFDEDGRGGFVAAGGLAADHAGHRLHAGRIGDRAVLRRRPCSPCRSARGTSRRARAAASARRR